MFHFRGSKSVRNEREKIVEERWLWLEKGKNNYNTMKIREINKEAIVLCRVVWIVIYHTYWKEFVSIS